MSDPDRTHTILVKIQSEMAAMRGEMAGMRSDMNARFDALEGRVEHLEHHAVVTNSKLDMVMARVAHVEIVCEQGRAQTSSDASFASRFEQRYTSDLAEIRSRLDRLEAKDPPTRP